MVKTGTNTLSYGSFIFVFLQTDNERLQSDQSCTRRQKSEQQHARRCAGRICTNSFEMVYEQPATLY